MKIAVTSPSFSKNRELVDRLTSSFPLVHLNSAGDKLAGKSLVEFIADAEGLIVGLEKIDADILKYCQNLKMISKFGVGLDNIDLAACSQRKVAIGWQGGVNKLSVAEMTIGFMLSLTRNLFLTSNRLKNGIWDKSGGFQLSGKTIGLIGVGNIGKEVIRLLAPFACDILVNDIIDQQDYYRKSGVKEVSKKEIFSAADIISLHTPLTDDTDSLVNRKVLESMKPTAFLINTARGRIVVERDLEWALTSGVIAGAALDVYDHEPPEDRALLELPNLICTPHIGGNSHEAVIAMGMTAIKHLREFFGK